MKRNAEQKETTSKDVLYDIDQILYADRQIIVSYISPSYVNPHLSVHNLSLCLNQIGSYCLADSKTPPRKF